MSLPIDIKDLIHGHSVELERLEFKQFLSELQKQTITLLLKQQDEWDFFS